MLVKMILKKKLYNLIWRRTLASQMSEAQFERTVVSISNGKTETFKSSGEVMVFDGFLKLYNEKTENTKLLPKLEKNSALSCIEILCKEVFTKHPQDIPRQVLLKRWKIQE